MTDVVAVGPGQLNSARLVHPPSSRCLSSTSAKKSVSTRLSLRAYDCPILLEHQCQGGQTDPSPACPLHVAGYHPDHRDEDQQIR